MILLANWRGRSMKRFVEGADRGQVDAVAGVPRRLGRRGQSGSRDRCVRRCARSGRARLRRRRAAATGRPAYHPAMLLKLYIYGYLNRVQSSRRLEREAGRNLEVIWLLGRLVPDHKTIADFRKDNGPAIRKVCARFVELCRADRPADDGERRDRRLEVQGGQQPRQQLHRGQDGAAPPADRGERRALSAPARHRRSAGADRRRWR